ncbi:MAG: hypothetical protein U1E76_12320 [Planctomycetota bacterium]
MTIVACIVAALLRAAPIDQGSAPAACRVCAARARLELGLRCAECREQKQACPKCTPIVRQFAALELPCLVCNRARALAQCEECQQKGDVCTICDVQDRVHFCLSCARTGAAGKTLHCDHCTAAARCADCIEKLRRLTAAPCAECAYRKRIAALDQSTGAKHTRDDCLFAALRALAADAAHCSACRIEARTCKECAPLVQRIDSVKCDTCER